MGKICHPVLFLSNLILVLGTLHYSELHPPNKYEREKQKNFSLPIITKYSPRKENDFFNKKVKDYVEPLNFHGQRRSNPSKIIQERYKTEKSKNVGLSSFMTEDSSSTSKRRDSTLKQSISRYNIFPNSRKKNIATAFPQNSTFENNYKMFSTSENYKKSPSPKENVPESSVYAYQNDFTLQNKKNADRRFFKEARSGKFYHSQRTSKACDPCNSVPWVPLFKVPNSYRQQRNRPVESHKSQQNTFKYDHHAYSSNTQKTVLPLRPLIPPPLPIYDGTISSSFGLPIGNIPTSHGLSPPINHLAPKVNKYGVQIVSNTLNYFPVQSILESSPFPELSPVPIVPIHDSNSFFKYDTSIPDLVPPLAKPVSSSNVVLTIAEQNSTKIEPSGLITTESDKIHAVIGKDSVLQTSSETDYSAYTLTNQRDSIQNQNQDYHNLEIVKSVPIAEFSSSLDYAVPLVQLPLANEGNLSPVQESSIHTPIIQTPPVAHHQENQNFNNFSSLSFLNPPPVTNNGLGGRDTSLSKFEISSYLNPSKITKHIFKESENSSHSLSSVPKPLPGHSLTWLFPDESNTLTSNSVNLENSFVTESQEIASIVNSELQPIKQYSLDGSSSNLDVTDSSKTKKIQIIIPYTTKTKNSFDNNALESSKHEVYQTITPPLKKSLQENNFFGESVGSTLSPSIELVRQHITELNREKKINNQGKNYLNIKGEKNKENQLAKDESNNNHKHLNEMHHIIATNIRELLRKEIEKVKTDQNVPLQNNIDNWTALEYSNHKTAGTKAPQEIITQALAVTSIPGTSISHLLLPSKKIPKEYFVTTALPIYDEPNHFLFNASSTSVNSQPFTAKPYATTSLYFPTPREDGRDSDEKRQKIESNFTSLPVQSNHEKNYTDVGRTKINNWSRLNENLVVPQLRETTRKESITSWTSHTTPKSTRNEKVQIVTPLPYSNRSYTSHSYRRTTRQVHTTEGTITEKLLTTKNTFNIRSLLNRYNSTKLEKISNWTSKQNFNLENSNYLNITRQNQSVHVIKLNKSNINDSKDNINSVKLQPVVSVTRNFTSEQPNSLHKSNNSEQISINDIFPFRNKELPWESNLNLNKQKFQENRQGKSLIKQVKLRSQQETKKSDSS